MNRFKVIMFVVVMLCLAASSCIFFDEYPTCPATFEGEEARRKFESLRKSLLVSRVTFFNEKIYLSTSGAIVEFAGERIDRLYKCRRADWDSFGSVGVDNISHSLWFESERDRRLIQFDGAKWNSFDLPSLPEPEYYSRDDAIAGFKGFNYDGRFILRNADRAWSYEGDNSWKTFNLPVTRCALGNPNRSIADGCLRKIGPVGVELCSVLHGDLIGQNIARGRPVLEEFSPQTDIVACKSGNSWKTVNPQGTPEFFSDKVVSSQNAMYATTKAGKIFRITKAGPESVATLGKVEALTVSSQGNLLVWFSGLGIYEFTDEWKKLYDVPFEAGSDLEGKLMTEDAGTLVVTASPPVGYEQKPLSDLVWIMKDGKVTQIL